jgi:hypothetical protein
MYCARCQAFWSGVKDSAVMPANVSSTQTIQWSPLEVVLHQTLRELKSAAELGCSLCAVLWSQPERDNAAWFPDDLDEPIDVILHFVTSNGPQPLISASFNRKAGATNFRSTHIKKRTVATFGGIIQDGW